MNKIILKTSIFAVTSFALLIVSNSVLASDFHGTVTANSNTLGATLGGGLGGVLTSPPIATPSANLYSSAQNVTLTASGASSIKYTTDGTAPTCGTGILYTSAISVASSMVIEAISCYTGNASSTVASYQYGITPPTTVPPPSGGGQGGGGVPFSGGSSSVTFSMGDSNGDHRINILDFVTLMANWGQTGSGNLADFNGDERVDILDFVLLMANWTN